MAGPRAHFVVGMPDRQALGWIARLVRLAWLPIVVSVGTRWVVASLEVLLSSVIARMVMAIGGVAPEAVPLPHQLAAWIDAGASPSWRSAGVAISLVVLVRLLQTLVEWALPWIHLVVNQEVTTKVVNISARPSASQLVEPSTVVQRWLLKLDISYLLQDSVAATAGHAGTVVIILVATYRANTSAGHASVACLTLWLLLAGPLLWRSLQASRRSAQAHEVVGRAVRDGVSLTTMLARPSIHAFWMKRTVPPQQELHTSIRQQGVWNIMLFGILGVVARGIPVVGLAAAFTTGGEAVSLAVLLYLGKLAGPLTGLVGLLPFIQANLISVQRLYDLAFRPEQETTTGSVDDLPGVRSVGLTDWTIDVPGGERLLYPTMAASSGEFLCLIGPSGAGKSTLLRSLLGLLPHRGGTLEINGRETASDSPAWLESCALVPQEPELLPGTIDDNLHGFPGWTDSDARCEALDILYERLPEGHRAEVGIDDKGVSVGQRRAIAVLQALGSDAPVLLLDEPVAGLDDSLARAIAAAIDEACQSGRIVVATTHEHDLLRIRTPSTRIVRLEAT